MTNAELAKRQERATAETFVIAQTEDGYRVYAPADPTKLYLVTSSNGAPQCTCPDFQLHLTDPAWRCKHILAVASRFPAASTPAESTDPIEAEERRAIQAEGREPRRRKAATTPTNGVAQMLVKRSVSPDGRIDSLSVEFSCPVEGMASDGIKDKAKRILTLQADIMGEFLNGREKKNGNGGNGASTPSQAPPTDQSPAVPGRMLSIGGMDGKWGRRLFITVQTNGHNLRHFGNRKQLGEFITAAGFPQFAQNIAEGVKLDLPCRIITEPSADGNYINITHVLPAEGNGGLQRVNR